MKTKPDKITPLVRKLKRLIAKHEILTEQEKELRTSDPWGVSPERRKAIDTLNTNSSAIMRMENQIITALLAQLQ